jgi:hypothetical protein
MNATITISCEDIDIEFMLPRCHAGPIIVPNIDYARYALSE